jgi:dipeptidyl aminopeptidase/acylaminoacyl peptidase
MKFILLPFLLFSLNLTASELQRELVSFQGSEKVEVYWSTPPGKGPFPVYILSYAFQGNFKGAAGVFVKYGLLPELAKSGYIGVIYSQAGQGESSGTPDHAGPLSREGLKAVIRHLKTLPIVDQKKIIIHGISMGAVLSGLVAAETPDVRVLILESGAYDTEKMMLRLFHQSLSDPEKKLTYDMLDEQSGTLPDRFLTRSVLPVADKIRASTLILAGAGDSMGTVSEAIRLHERIPGSRLRIFPFANHDIHRNEKGPAIKDFVEEIIKQ